MSEKCQKMSENCPEGLKTQFWDIFWIIFAYLVEAFVWWPRPMLWNHVQIFSGTFWTSGRQTPSCFAATYLVDFWRPKDCCNPKRWLHLCLDDPAAYAREFCERPTRELLGHHLWWSKDGLYLWVHLSHRVDLGSITIFKYLSHKGHAPRLYECEGGRYHYKETPDTMWADVGNSMYGSVGTKFDRVDGWKGNVYNDVSKGHVTDSTYNLYYMYAVLNIDVASLLGVAEDKLTGWWAQVNMIQRDAYIQSCSMLGGKSYDNIRFEQICMYTAILPLMTLQETISVTRQGTSHKSNCPVPSCRFCGKTLGRKTNGIRISDVTHAAWAHMQSCIGGKSYTWNEATETYQVVFDIPADYHPNMDHLELIQAQLTRDGKHGSCLWFYAWGLYCCNARKDVTTEETVLWSLSWSVQLRTNSIRTVCNGAGPISLTPRSRRKFVC